MVTDLTDHDMLIRIDERVENTDKNVTALVAKVDTAEKAQGKLGIRVTRLEERMSIWQKGQAIYSTAVALLAGFISARR